MSEFTFTTIADPSNTGNTVSTASVNIIISPTTPIFNITNMLPGESYTGTINIANTGTVDVFYFVSADWRESGTTTPGMATILASKLHVTVEAGIPHVLLFDGVLKDLIDKPDSGRLLLTATSEDILFALTLPAETGNIVQNTSIIIDFIFVAVQA